MRKFLLTTAVTFGTLAPICAFAQDTNPPSVWFWFDEEKKIHQNWGANPGVEVQTLDEMTEDAKRITNPEMQEQVLQYLSKQRPGAIDADREHTKQQAMVPACAEKELVQQIEKMINDRATFGQVLKIYNIGVNSSSQCVADALMSNGNVFLTYGWKDIEGEKFLSVHVVDPTLGFGR